jgi:hypothetical protein
MVEACLRDDPRTFVLPPGKPCQGLAQPLGWGQSPWRSHGGWMGCDWLELLLGMPRDTWGCFSGLGSANSAVGKKTVLLSCCCSCDSPCVQTGAAWQATGLPGVAHGGKNLPAFVSRCLASCLCTSYCRIDLVIFWLVSRLFSISLFLVSHTPFCCLLKFSSFHQALLCFLSRLS